MYFLQITYLTHRWLASMVLVTLSFHGLILCDQAPPDSSDLTHEPSVLCPFAPAPLRVPHTSVSVLFPYTVSRVSFAHTLSSI